MFGDIVGLLTDYKIKFCNLFFAVLSKIWLNWINVLSLWCCELVMWLWHMYVLKIQLYTVYCFSVGMCLDSFSIFYEVIIKLLSIFETYFCLPSVLWHLWWRPGVSSSIYCSSIQSYLYAGVHCLRKCGKSLVVVLCQWHQHVDNIEETLPASCPRWSWITQPPNAFDALWNLTSL